MWHESAKSWTRRLLRLEYFCVQPVEEVCGQRGAGYHTDETAICKRKVKPVSFFLSWEIPLRRIGLNPTKFLRSPHIGVRPMLLSILIPALNLLPSQIGMPKRTVSGIAVLIDGNFSSMRILLKDRAVSHIFYWWWRRWGVSKMERVKLKWPAFPNQMPGMECGVSMHPTFLRIEGTMLVLVFHDLKASVAQHAKCISQESWQIHMDIHNCLSHCRLKHYAKLFKSKIFTVDEELAISNLTYNR